MDLDEARRFVSENHQAVMVTERGDGRPQTSVVSCGVDEAGRVVISTRETAMKARNLRRRPRVTLCVLSDDFRAWVQVDGQAEVVSLPEAMDGLVGYYRRVAGEHPDWDE